VNLSVNLAGRPDLVFVASTYVIATPGAGWTGVRKVALALQILGVAVIDQCQGALWEGVPHEVCSGS
jgi:hypothetical protein